MVTAESLFRSNCDRPCPCGWRYHLSGTPFIYTSDLHVSNEVFHHDRCEIITLQRIQEKKEG